MARRDLAPGVALEVWEDWQAQPALLHLEKRDTYLEVDKDGDLSIEFECQTSCVREQIFIPVDHVAELLRASGYTVTKKETP